MNVIKMEERVETMKALQPEVMGPLASPRLVECNPKRELLSSIGLFIGTGLLGVWFGAGATSGRRWLTVWKIK